MKTLSRIVNLLGLVVILSACQKDWTRISNGKMERIIADLYLADATLDKHPDYYDNDSVRLSVKQSIFEHHGVTKMDFDSTLFVLGKQGGRPYEKVALAAVQRLQSDYDYLLNYRPISLDRNKYGDELLTAFIPVAEQPILPNPVRVSVDSIPRAHFFVEPLNFEVDSVGYLLVTGVMDQVPDEILEKSHFSADVLVTLTNHDGEVVDTHDFVVNRAGYFSTQFATKTLLAGSQVDMIVLPRWNKESKPFQFRLSHMWIMLSDHAFMDDAPMLGRVKF